MKRLGSLLDGLYRGMRLLHYRNLFGQVREKAGSLSATEAFSAEVIYLLDRPSVGAFASFLGISQPNASYKVNSLAAKGYIERLASDDDRREFRLGVTEKFLNYYGRLTPDLSTEMKGALSAFSDAEQNVILRFWERLNDMIVVRARS